MTASQDPEAAFSTRARLIDGRQFPFYIVEHAAHAYLPLVGADAWAVYTTLVFFGNRSGECMPSLKTLAERTGLSENTVRKGVRLLRQHGLIEAETGRYDPKTKTNAPNRYILITPGRQAGRAADEAPVAPPRKRNVVWDQLVALTLGGHGPTNDAEEAKLGKAVKLLRQSQRSLGLSDAEMHAELARRVAVYRQKYPRHECSPLAIANNWSSLSERAHEAETSDGRESDAAGASDVQRYRDEYAFAVINGGKAAS